jgi:hypothetical protein
METDPAELTEIRLLGTSTVQRIEWLTLAIGFAAALGTETASRQWRSAAGLAVGTVLGWLNFRLLRRGAEVLLQVRQAQEPGKKSRMPILGAMLRYSLIGLSVYVSFRYLHVPLASLMAGLCAFGVATIAASVWAILNPEE